MKVDGQLTVVGLIGQVIALTFTAGSPNTVATDASMANNFSVTVTGAFTLSNPTGCTQADDMQILVWRIIQGTGGGFVLTLDTQFKLGTDIATVVLSTTAGAIDYLAARYRYVNGGSNDRFDVVAFIRGYS